MPYSDAERVSKPSGIEIRDPAELIDAFGDGLHVLAFFFRVFGEFFGDFFGVDALSRDRMCGVAQDANDFGREHGL